MAVYLPGSDRLATEADNTGETASQIKTCFEDETLRVIRETAAMFEARANFGSAPHS